MGFISRFVLKRIWGWKTIGSFPPLKKYIVIVVPHTHWLDFPLGILVRNAQNAKINFIAKQSLFKPPFGWWFNKLGGVPVNRKASTNMVQQIASIYKNREEFRLSLSPEGTRKKVTEWKTGFYYIAKEAQIPIVLVAFDYGKKEIKFSKPQYTTLDISEDMANYKAFFKGVIGKVAENSF